MARNTWRDFWMWRRVVGEERRGDWDWDWDWELERRERVVVNERWASESHGWREVWEASELPHWMSIISEAVSSLLSEDWGLELGLGMEG